MQTEHFIAVELTLAEVCLIDEEVYVGGVFFVDDTLELVVGSGWCEGPGIGECSCGYYTVCHLDAWQYILLAFLLYFKVEVELGLLHVGLVEIVDRDGHGASVVVGDHGVVAAHFLSLESHGCCFLLGCAVYEHRGH